MQHASASKYFGSRPSFNPHRSLRTGATVVKQQSVANRMVFQSSPVTEDRCNRSIRLLPTVFTSFQSSPVTEDRCNANNAYADEVALVVSILTGH